LTGIKNTRPPLCHSRVMKSAAPISVPTGRGPDRRLAAIRLAREWQTISAMIHLHCQDRHGRPELCPDCRELLAYAARRLERCRFGADKPTCARCPVHCYQPTRREQIKVVMRYAGPRMLWRHPFLSLTHWLDGLRSVPNTEATPATE
jgi:hypothetical protein